MSMILVRYAVTLTVQTPLHIGTGEKYREGADFVIETVPGRGRQARVIDIDRALQAMDAHEIRSARNGFIARAAGERARNAATRTLAPIRGDGNPNEVRQMMRLPDGRPYIPGSSIKGSIRTAFLNAALAGFEGGQFAFQPLPGLIRRLESARQGDRPAADLEEEAFGLDFPARGERPAPWQNRDLNRAFRVSDFEPIGEVPVAFTSVGAYRLRGDAAGSKIPIWCEAIQPGATFRGVLTFEFGGMPWLAAEQDPLRRGGLLDHFFVTWASGAKRLARVEAARWRDGFDPTVARFYGQMAAAERPAVLGWGGGWLSKTVGPVLNQEQTRELLQRFPKIQPMPRGAQPRTDGLFPLTRRLAQTTQGLRPPGWLTFRPDQLQ